MNAQDAMRELRGTLIQEGPDRYRLTGGKTVLSVRLLGALTPIRFAPRDHVALRIDEANLIVEDLGTHAIRKAFPWSRIESVVAGEPESDNSDLFQG